MKQEALPLRAFIKDYRLENPNGIVCFTASVQFMAEGVWFKFISQVHIITIVFKHLDVIYLLNPEIDTKNIQTMFTDNNGFNYTRTRRFEIREKSEQYGNYSINIIPISNDCGADTFTELFAKLYN